MQLNHLENQLDEVEVVSVGCQKYLMKERQGS